jgi:hypothetical protein
MHSLPIQWEVAGINGGGASMVIPVEKPILVTGFQIDVSIGFLSGYGFSEVLAICQFITGNPTFSADKAAFLTGPNIANPGAFGGSHFVNPNGYAVIGGGDAFDGTLFRVILKTFAPNSTARTMTAGGLSMKVPSGYNLVCYMGHAFDPTDAEMQGAIFYELAS